MMMMCKCDHNETCPKCRAKIPPPHTCQYCAAKDARIRELEEVNINLRNVIVGDEEQLKRVVDQNAALRDRLVAEHQERELEVQELQSRLAALEKVAEAAKLWLDLPPPQGEHELDKAFQLCHNLRDALKEGK